jgi:chromosome partitioning protein
MIIAITNQKGGVGKTTTTANLGVLLARDGRRVLLVDADPQFALTRQLGIEERSLGVNLVDVLAGRAGAEDAIVGDVHGVDVIASGRDLAGVELSLVGEIGRERFLRDALEPVVGRYDDLLIDTPPNLGLLTVNALVCADTVLAPVSAEDEASVQGIVELRATIAKLERLGGPRPRLLSLLTRSAPRRIISEVIDKALIELDLAPVARIPARAAVAQAAAAHVPLAVSARDSAVTLAYDRLIDHMAEVINL